MYNHQIDLLSIWNIHEYYILGRISFFLFTGFLSLQHSLLGGDLNGGDNANFLLYWLDYLLSSNCFR